MKILDIHERFLPGSAAQLWPLVRSLGSADDRLWPGAPWPPLVLEQPLRVGSTGAHADVRHRVTRIVEGSLLELAVEVDGIVGTHRFELFEPSAGTVCLRHEIEANASFAGWALWHIVILPLHAAILEEALDNAEQILTGTVSHPFQLSRWVRWLIAYETRRYALGAR